MKGFSALDIIINIYVYSFIPLCIHFIPQKNPQVRQRRIHRIRLELKCEWYKFLQDFIYVSNCTLTFICVVFFFQQKGAEPPKNFYQTFRALQSVVVHMRTVFLCCRAIICHFHQCKMYYTLKYRCYRLKYTKCNINCVMSSIAFETQMKSDRT